MNPVFAKRIGLGLGLALLTAVVTYGWGIWLEQLLVRPLVVGWVWLVFYVTHLPQAAVWFAVLALASLPLLRRLKPFPKVALPLRRPSPVGSKGPLSAWQQALTLALKGKLYRKKLHLYLQDQLADLAHVSPQAQRALEQLRVSDHAVFLRALHALLDELDVPGAPHAAG